MILSVMSTSLGVGVGVVVEEDDIFLLFLRLAFYLMILNLTAACYAVKNTG